MTPLSASNVLPDCRAKSPTGGTCGFGLNWIPIFCANCGKSGGVVPEENMTFVFYLCNYCVEVYGAIANTMMVPDEVFWAELATEQAAKSTKET